MSRTARLAQALAIGTGFQLTAMVVGLWLTPILLRLLGDAAFGRWQVVGQMLGYLALLDLGVTLALPREVARAGPADVPRVAGRAVWLAVVQFPAVLLAAAALWWVVTAGRPDLRLPLGAVLGTYTALYPLRFPAAVLTGLQDIIFVGLLQAAAWAITTAVSVGLAFAGAGLLSLAAGWATGQIVLTAAGLWRLARRHPAAFPARGWPGRAALVAQLKPSLWMALGQLAQLFIFSSDLLIIGWALGGPAVVAYSCTVKLAGIAAQHVFGVMTTSLPTFAALHSAGDPARFVRAVRAAGFASVSAGGAAALVIAAANPAFVSSWVGPERFAGPGVSTLAVCALLLRQVGFTWWSVAYTLGYERRQAIAVIVDGTVLVGVALALTPGVGPVGVPIGSLVGVLVVYLPAGVATVAAGTGLSVRAVVGWVTPWAVRFLIVFVPVAALATHPLAMEPVNGGLLTAAGLGLYVGLLWPLTAEEPLRGYRDGLLRAARRRAGGVFGRNGRAPAGF